MSRFPPSLVLIGLLAPASFAQEVFKNRLEKSPRHHEWVKIKNGDRTLQASLVFPEVKHKALAVLVIHENKGLTDFVMAMADRLAEAGYVAIAPDLLSGRGPGGGNTDAFKSTQAATKSLYGLDPDQVTADLHAAADFVKKLPAASGKLAVCGFCWGGSQTFRFATNRKDLAAAFVFYGTGPESLEDVRRISCPVHGFYGGNDARVNATLKKTAQLMKEAGKKFEPVIYEGAGHGFLRSGEGADAMPVNRRGMEQAWTRWRDLLKTVGR